jgi:N6-adenosine-specific RNA methylase IME4
VQARQKHTRSLANPIGLNFEKLSALPVGNFAADDCVLFLWAVDPLLDKAFELIRSWGFQYKTVGFY